MKVAEFDVRFTFWDLAEQGPFCQWGTSKALLWHRNH
ncbi:hypothetical protein SHM7688_03887 [Shimia marina]|uniref:Uncharacterized protein n=1 Tax=Shimia marina TaxID=321267 RepID=A0A0P1FCA1_9RHOB|nr:hypothetical protein SHM7688_03887 [Shimia marina]